jgi:hypothetical protein
MNSVEPGRQGASYTVLTPREQTILIASMVESRNRVYKIATEVFGPVAATWDDQKMMANFDSWIAEHGKQGLSHGLNAFRMILETSHMMLNQIYQYSKTTEDDGYTMSILDRYAFKKFRQDSGMEYFNKFSSYGDFDSNADGQHVASDTKGAIFGFIDSLYPGTLDNKDIRAYLCQPLPANIGFSFDTPVGAMPDPPSAASMSADKLNFLKGMKWLIEQWFGASTWVRPNYNNMPKPVALAPKIEYWPNPSRASTDSRYPAGFNLYGYYEEDVRQENINGRSVLVPQMIYDPVNSSRSYGWDRVAGSFNWHEDSFVDSSHKTIASGTYEWFDIYNALRSKYGENNLGYISPNVPYYDTMLNDGFDCHNTYARKQFSGLHQNEVLGRGGNLIPYQNSWAVNLEGRLTMAGEKMDSIRMTIYNFLDKAATQRYKRADRKYQEDKEQQKNEEADDEKYSQKVANAQKSERTRMEQQLQAQTQKHQKEEQAGHKKAPKKAPKKA